MRSQRKRNSRSLHPDREEYLDSLAESIIDYYFQADEPITPRFIADDYRITYGRDNYGDEFNGMLLFDEEDQHFFIAINEHHQSDIRQRFTFCHELGHFFIDGHRNALIHGEVPYLSSFTGFSSERVVEREADFFASCLLMPRSRAVRDYRNHRRFSFAIIQELSRKYQMSEVATIYRLLHLDLHPLMIVKASNGKIVSIQKSNDFYHYPKGGKDFIPEDSLMYEAVRGRVRVSKTEELWTGDWFRVRGEEIALFEHCIYYEQFGICYSILWQN